MTLATPWHTDRLLSPAAPSQAAIAHVDAARSEAVRDARHPLSRWYLLPLADAAAKSLSPTWVRPWQITLAGLALAGCAVGALLAGWPSWTAAVFVLAAWLCDRIDGKLARRQGSASSSGAWLDANLDELCDIGLHAAVAGAASQLTHTQLPWLLFAAFVAGKFLFFHAREEPAPRSEIRAVEPSTTTALRQDRVGRLRGLLNLPGNADVRAHLLAAALALNWLLAELVLVAAYYNLRWLVRYAAVAGRSLRKGGAS